MEWGIDCHINYITKQNCYKRFSTRDLETFPTIFSQINLPGPIEPHSFILQPQTLLVKARRWAETDFAA
jgi:hypothetical protein